MTIGQTENLANSIVAQIKESLREQGRPVPKSRIKTTVKDVPRCQVNQPEEEFINMSEDEFQQ